MSAADNEDLSAEERDLYNKLPRSAALDPLAEDRLIAALRARSGSAAPVASSNRRRATLAVASFATAASFVVGVFVGRATSADSLQNAGSVSTPSPGSSAVAGKSDSALVTVTRIITM